MNRYQEHMDHIKAPDALRQKTMEQLRGEQVKEASIRKKSGLKKWIPVTAGAVAAALLLVVGLNFTTSQKELVYNPVPQSVLRTIPTETEDDLSLEEYGAYLEMDIHQLLPDAQLLQWDISAQCSGETLVEDLGTLYYNAGGKPVMLELSATHGVSPKELNGAEPSMVGKQTVVIGVTPNQEERMAAFEYNGISFLLVARNMDQGSFETLLDSMVKNLKNIF